MYGSVWEVCDLTEKLLLIDAEFVPVFFLK